MRTIEALVAAVRKEAERAEFPVDTPVYEREKRDPLQPVLFAGNLQAPVCVFGRDLGKDEVAVGQPLVGAGGRLVRTGVYQAAFGEEPTKSNRRIEEALEHVLLTNTVPYKPPGNKAYSEAVKERFRPFVAELLVGHWKGNRVISLGNEAFEWFGRYVDSQKIKELWAGEDRYERDLECELEAKIDGETVKKRIILCPLPHPSPLNARWYGKFPELLARRLAAVSS